MRLATLAAIFALGASSAATAAAPFYEFTISQNGKLVEAFSLNINTGKRETGAFSDYIWYSISNDTLGHTAAYFGDKATDNAFGTGYVNTKNPSSYGAVIPAFSENASVQFFSGKATNISLYNGETFTADCYTVTISPAPEPSTWVLMVGGVGLLGFAMRASRRRREDDIGGLAAA